MARRALAAALTLLLLSSCRGEGSGDAATSPRATPTPATMPPASPTPSEVDSAEPEPTPAALPDVTGIGAGLFCRDLAAAGYSFADAVRYWVAEGQPARMDADLDGVPCETVYPASEVDALITRPSTVEAWIVKWNDELVGDLPPEVERPSVVECDVLGPFPAGRVFACTLVPQTEPGTQLDGSNLVVLVLDDQGSYAALNGMEYPGSTAGVLERYRENLSGLLCRDLPARALFPFNDGYFWAVAYWFLEGRPDRMDADLDGFPCETVFSPRDVARVWRGGLLGAP